MAAIQVHHPDLLRGAQLAEGAVCCFQKPLVFPCQGFSIRTMSRAGIGMQAHSCVQGDSFKGQLWLESFSSA